MSVLAAFPVREWRVEWRLVALCAATVVILILRRPDQFLHPYIWAEDGEILQGYAHRGLASIIEPIAGYYILTSKLISLTALQISVVWYPEIALALTTAFTCAIVVAIALSPTHLRCPSLCALAALAVPTDPENFAVALYSFWWAGFLLVLALLWDTERGFGWLRFTYIVLGGMSSFLAVPFAALFALRALWERRREEYVATAVVAGVALVQGATILSQANLMDLPK